MDNQVNIICMKWGAKYDATNVNRLRGMVKRHLSRPHRFVCFTDNATGVRDDVEVMPLPHVNIPQGPERCWRKLGVFAPEETGLRGLTLFLDLDLVLLDSIDCFFEHPGEFIIIRDWLRDGTTGRAVGNSSVFRFDAEKHHAILESFNADAQNIAAQHRCDQDWMTHYVGTPTYWPEAWCRSFKRHCLQPFPVSLFKAPKRPPETKILVFHGDPKPEVAANEMTMKPLALRFTKPAPWLNQFLEVA